MPSYVSKGGIIVPAKEHAVLPHLSGTDKEIYDGPDRAAEEELATAHGVDANGKPKVTFFGSHFRKDPDFINRVRQMGYKNIDDYLADIGYNEEEEIKKADLKAAEIVVHKEPAKTPVVKTLGGGTDKSGQNKSYTGGFGEEKLEEA
jgi:hypothetical protein